MEVGGRWAVGQGQKQPEAVRAEKRKQDPRRIQMDRGSRATEGCECLWGCGQGEGAREWIINEVNFKNKIKLVHLNKLIISKRRKKKRTSNRGRRSAIKMHKQQNCSTHILRGGCVCVLILLRWTLEEEKERERTKKRRRYLLHMHSFFRDKASECV